MHLMCCILVSIRSKTSRSSFMLDPPERRPVSFEQGPSLSKATFAVPFPWTPRREAKPWCFLFYHLLVSLV
jgi:hypothetical protein